mmetsp:Transcript_64234/g.150604  ORF Transcript_64234/g.150604 Transcript_64234/m.150604 type:complete len:218 (-) Transcript_64234:231-884(-)
MAKKSPGFSDSIFCTSADVLFLYTRSVFFKLRKTWVVSVTLAFTMTSLMGCTMGASLVAIKRVPMLIPSAPMASAAASWTPVAVPPLATKGMDSSCEACAKSTQFPTSSSPGWPPQSKPSIEIMSAPIFCAVNACLTATHLWMTNMPASLHCLITFSGLRPAVSTTFTFSSINTCTMPSKSGGTPTGNSVMFTPNGLSVSWRHFLISSCKASLPFGG